MISMEKPGFRSLKLLNVAQVAKIRSSSTVPVSGMNFNYVEFLSHDVNLALFGKVQSLCNLRTGEAILAVKGIDGFTFQFIILQSMRLFADWLGAQAVFNSAPNNPDDCHKGLDANLAFGKNSSKDN